MYKVTKQKLYLKLFNTYKIRFVGKFFKAHSRFICFFLKFKFKYIKISYLRNLRMNCAMNVFM